MAIASHPPAPGIRYVHRVKVRTLIPSLKYAVSMTAAICHRNVAFSADHLYCSAPTTRYFKAYPALFKNGSYENERAVDIPELSRILIQRLGV